MDEVLTLIFADDDSEADNVPSDDDRSSDTSDSDSDCLDDRGANCWVVRDWARKGNSWLWRKCRKKGRPVCE